MRLIKYQTFAKGLSCNSSSSFSPYVSHRRVNCFHTKRRSSRSVFPSKPHSSFVTLQRRSLHFNHFACNDIGGSNIGSNYELAFGTPQYEQEARSSSKSIMHAIYRPSKNEAVGSAVQFSYDPRKQVVFIQVAKQKVLILEYVDRIIANSANKGPKLPPGVSGNQFDWSKKIIVKIQTTEMGKFLGTLQGKIKDMELLHRSGTPQEEKMVSVKMAHGASGTMGLMVNKATTKAYPHYDLDGIRGPPSSVAIYFDEAEAAILREFFSASIRASLGF